MSFFEWVARCCELLGLSAQQGTKMMPKSDPSWFFCFDDGMTPEEAVAEYRAKMRKPEET